MLMIGHSCLIRSGPTISLAIVARRLAWAVRFQARNSCSVWASINTPRGLNIMLKFSFWLRSSYSDRDSSNISDEAGCR
jgi:hypothetical protein